MENTPVKKAASKTSTPTSITDHAKGEPSIPKEVKAQAKSVIVNDKNKEMAASIYANILRVNLEATPPKGDESYKQVVAHSIGMTEIAVAQFEKRFQ